MERTNGKGRSPNNDETTMSLYSDIQWVAHRQLLGSTVVAVMIAAAACLTEMRPVRAETAAAPPHRLAAAQQPSFVVAPINRLAVSAKRQIELP
jgi:hypothetical protein